MSTTIDDLLLSTAEVEIQATDSQPPAVAITAYSGGLMNVPGWGPLVIDLAGLDLSAAQIGILADHDASLKGIVSHGKASVRDGRLYVTGTISLANEAAEKGVALAKSGFMFQASVGVSPTASEQIRPGQLIAANGRAFKAPASGCLLVKAGRLLEVSIVALGADPETSVAIAASLKDQCMPETEVLTTAEDIRAEAAAETERINATRKACKGKFGEIEARAIREGRDEQRTELEVLRESRPKAGPIYAGGYSVAASHKVLEAAILAHMGCDHLAAKHLGADAAQLAHELRATNLVDLCRAALSTYSLPMALGDAANKVLFEAYTESPATWRAFAAVKSTNDFKDHTGVRPSDTGDLTQLPPGGEIKHGGIKEATYKYSVDTFAKILSIDRRDIINDDLTMFDDTARSLGRAAMRSLSDLVYTVLLANAGSFFSTGHGNYDEGAPTALASASLATGIAKMMAQRDDEYRDLDIRARTLLVPPELQQTAKELLQSDYIQRASNDLPTGNALKNSVSLEVEPRLSTSTGSPARAPKRGTYSPRRRTRRSWSRSCKASSRPPSSSSGSTPIPTRWPRRGGCSSTSGPHWLITEPPTKPRGKPEPTPSSLTDRPFTMRDSALFPSALVTAVRRPTLRAVAPFSLLCRTGLTLEGSWNRNQRSARASTRCGWALRPRRPRPRPGTTGGSTRSPPGC